MVERVNRELSKFFIILLDELKHTSWYDKMEIIDNILNEVDHDTTEATPMELMLKKQPTRFWRNWLWKSNGNEPDYKLKLPWTQERIQTRNQKSWKI